MRLLRAILKSALLVSVVGCGQPTPEATIRAYTGTPEEVLVRVRAGDRADTWLLPGGDVVVLLYAGPSLGSDGSVEFLDAATCSVLAVATNLPQHVRVGLSFVDPRYVATVAAVTGKVEDGIRPAETTEACHGE